MFYEFIWKSCCKFPCKGLLLFGKLYVINSISLNCIVYTYDHCVSFNEKHSHANILFLQIGDNDLLVIDMFTNLYDNVIFYDLLANDNKTVYLIVIVLEKAS